MMLLVVMLTSVTAWAADPWTAAGGTGGSGTTLDPYFVNMPAKDAATSIGNAATLNVPDGITSFKLYDDGGSNGAYSGGWYTGYLIITAPENYFLHITGNISTESLCDKLTIYDNGTGSGSKLLDEVSGSLNNINVHSSNNVITVYFHSDNSTQYDGLDLTVTLAQSNDLSIATITKQDTYWWNNGTAIDIAYTVKAANGTTLAKGTDYTETIKKGGVVVSEGVKDVGDYTLTINGINSYTGEQTVNFTVAQDICLYGAISGDYPNWTMTLKYGDYDADPADAGANKKKKYTPGSSAWWNASTNTGMKTIVIDASCQNYQGTSLQSLFNNWSNVTSITGLENLNYHNTVTDMSQMFYQCYALTTLDASGLNTASVTNMKSMFFRCSALTTINFGDGTKFNTSDVTDMRSMFSECTALTVLDLSAFSTTQLYDLEFMFKSSSNLQTIIVSTSWDVVSGSRDGSDMFDNCSAIVGEQGTTYNSSYIGRSYARIDGGTSNKGYLTGRYTITYNTNGGTMPTASYITTFTGKDDAFDLPTPTRTGYAFAGWCENSDLSGTAITSYPAGTRGNKTLYAKWSQALYAVISGETMTLKCGDPSTEAGSVTYDGYDTWNTSFKNTITTAIVDESCQNYTGTTLSGLFYECKNLTTISGLDYLNTENVTNMDHIFSLCLALTSVDVSKFNTSKVTDMSFMFAFCQSLTTLDVSSFNTAKVTDMAGLFYHCDHLTTIDIKNFNTGEVKHMDYMFESCVLLTTIVVGEGWSTAKVTSSEGMFIYDTNLVGQEGTAYNVSNVDATYACVDAAGTTPGYLSLGLNEATGIVNAAAYTGKKAQFTRTGITANAYSTVCLPFDFTTPTGCTIYGFQGIHYDENALGAGQGAWVADIAETTTMTAHTPYIFTCTGTEATFSGTASNAADYSSELESNAVSATVGDDQAWTFKGTYSAIDWSGADPTEPTYGFSTYVPAETIAAGTFVRFVQGASLAPFRARLIYSGTDTNLSARTRGTADELPQYIIVRIVSAGNTPTVIGTMDTRTGEISTDGWFDLNGRRLSGKPAQKGLYINNGKTVVIK